MARLETTVINKVLPDGSESQIKVIKRHPLGREAAVLVTEKEEHMFVEYRGQLIAQRHPGELGVKQPSGLFGFWVSLVPEFEVIDGPNQRYIEIKQGGRRVLVH